MRRAIVIAYVAAVDAVAVAALFGLPAGAGTWALPVVLVAAAAATGALPVRIPSLKVEFTATHPILLGALALSGPRTAVAVAVAAVAGASVVGRRSLRGLQVAFNAGAQVVAAALAGWAFAAAGGEVGGDLAATALALALAGLVYFSANSGLVSTVVAIEGRRSVARVWRDAFRWAAVSYCVGLSVAAALIPVLREIGAAGLALAVPPCWMLVAFYRAHRERLEEQHRRLRQAETLNVELEAKVAARTRELQELDALKETLVQTLVHDLKNPLTAVLGNLDLLDRGVDGEARATVERCRSAALVIDRMVMDLLDVAGLEENRLVLRPSRVDARDLAARAVEAIESTARRRSVSLGMSAPAGPLPLVGDPGVLRRVLDNLLVNAIEHSPPGGRVEIRVTPRRHGVEIAVCDEGPGVPPEHRHRVFEKFARLDLRRSGISANRGLGLTFCRLVAEAHGGSIGVDDAPGGGARFVLTLPRTRPIALTA